jgi:hypothetical protein
MKALETKKRNTQVKEIEEKQREKEVSKVTRIRFG